MRVTLREGGALPWRREKHHLLLGRPPPSRLPARTVPDKPISCVERCTQRSRAKYGRLSARNAVSRQKRACCIKGQPMTPGNIRLWPHAHESHTTNATAHNLAL